ncbi:MAG: chemotaxis protein CheD [Proteobacteria bacterium]|nr:chemotaxis protein CheD [Pseudomonadota bacterium]MBU0964944.1 chemotaxis protein CheD [Pseudomonadota bacterium]
MTQLPFYWLHPGDLFVSREPTLVTTILGSCVTVCLFHPLHRAGAMCHCLLPVGDHERNNPGYRYVDSTLPRMMHAFKETGITFQGMQAKLFGGAIMTAKSATLSETSLRVGPANVEMARNVLKNLGIPLVAECVGGHKGYKLFFNSGNGDVFLSRL